MQDQTSEYILQKGMDLSEATKLLEKRRILYEIEDAFNSQVEEYSKNMDKFKEHEEQIKEYDLKIQEDFVKHCKVLAENKNKKNRAIRHLIEEKQLREQKKQQVEEEKNSLKLLDQHKDLFEKKIKHMVKYEQYLKNVVEQNQDCYNDVNDLIQRFQILENSNKELKSQLFDFEQKQNHLDIEINKFEKTKNDQIIVLNNEIAQLQKELETVEIKYSKAKDKTDQNENQSSNKQQLLAKLLLSIDNIYDQALQNDIKIRFDNQDDLENRNQKNSKKKKQKQSNKNAFKYNVDEYLKKLDYIKEKSEALNKIFELVEKQSKSNMNTYIQQLIFQLKFFTFYQYNINNDSNEINYIFYKLFTLFNSNSKVNNFQIKRLHRYYER